MVYLALCQNLETILTPIEEKTLAIAAIFQHCMQVREIATTGSTQSEKLKLAVETILETEPDSTETLFKGAEGVKDGLNLIKQHNNGSNELEVTRYVITVLFLSGKLLKNKTMLEQLSKGIKTAKDQVDFFSIDHNNIFSSLGGLYGQTISTLNPRIMVSGEQIYLNTAENADRIRTLLLAAIRAGILWRQIGGSRWQLLFQRKKIVKTATTMLEQLQNL